MKTKAPILSNTLEEREYQTNDLATIETAFDEFRSVLYELPTGGGKSVVTVRFMEPRKEQNIIIFAHKKKLLTQMAKHLATIGVKRYGTLWGGKAENMDANIVVVSIRSAVKDARLTELLKRKWDWCIVDEARHTRTTSYDTVLNRIETEQPQCKLFGMDATPFRKDKKRLDKHFQHMVVSQEDIASLTAKGYLQSCKVIATPFDKEALKEAVKEVANDYQSTELSNYMRQEKYLDYVVNQYREYGEGRQALCFAVDKAHAKDLTARFIKGGFTKIAQVDSDMDDDTIEKAYADFESKKIQILVNIEMVTEGVDLPVCGCIIGARPTKSLTLYLQMGGRGTRPDGEHDYFILLDCCGWTDEFGTLASKKHWSLNPDIDPNNPRKKNKIVGRRANGELVEDITDFIGELIELTPEQYMTQLKDGIEVAKAANATIQEKITNLYAALEELTKGIMKKDKDSSPSMFNVRVEKGRHGGKGNLVFVTNNHPKMAAKPEDADEDFEENQYADWNDFHKAIIALDKTKYYCQMQEADGYYGRQQPIEEYMKLTMCAGGINKTLLDDKEGAKYTHKVLEIWEQISDLETSKVDLSQFKEAAKLAKKEQWEKAVQEHAATEGEFLFVNKLHFDSFFKGYSSNRIIGIGIPSKSINNYHNKITLITEDRWSSKPSTEEKNYVKGEKVMEMIERGGWKVEMLKVEEA